MRRAAVLALAIVALAGACKKKETASANVNAQNKVVVRPVRLFYESNQMLLIGEQRSLPLPESNAAALPIVVRELMKGPATPDAMRLFPQDTVVRAAYLLPNGTAIVDLGGTTLSNGWGTGSHQELMAAYSLAQTVSANFTDGRRVRVLINGTQAETLAGHVSLSRSLEPRAEIVDPRFR